MPSARRTIVIERPIEAVFAFFTTPSNDLRWRPHVREIDGPAQLSTGARIHQVVAGPGGRGIPADIEVTEYAPSTAYAFRVVAGPARPQGAYAFTSAGPDATEVTFSLSAELGGLKKLVMGAPVQKSMDGEMASLDTAKRLIESG
ncbi:SRPBCC family protein [Intrasporangium flavum]|uniref:SRPBCC family protein n=1 Tax=Intrasporangium flavum TaxID=1428657 RepID=UPI00096FADD5|nr:SRPBCC family protein [Intrasporangium flavum]